ncbi:MAG: GNAT family N-acetyltransferase [Rhizobiales bacterium]|nr:GNAT family N-acetyltransferase [Hyphomicrobiales bacterium]NRB14900.1 GNAT family N-acetyltransferase [Hyphomicrobiales bacterium]
MVADDVDALQQLYMAARIATFDWLPPKLFKLEDLQKSIEGEWVFVAIIDGEIAGFCSIWLIENFIHNLFVAPNSQGGNIGKSLINYAFAHGLKKPARLKCTVKNTNACGFYTANGWVVEQANVENNNDLSDDPYHLFVLT